GCVAVAVVYRPSLQPRAEGELPSARRPGNRHLRPLNHHVAPSSRPGSSRPRGLSDPDDLGPHPSRTRTSGCSLAMFVDAGNGGIFAGICGRRFLGHEAPHSPRMGQVRNRPSTEGACIAPDSARLAPCQWRGRYNRQVYEAVFLIYIIIHNVANGLFQCALPGKITSLLGRVGPRSWASPMITGSNNRV